MNFSYIWIPLSIAALALICLAIIAVYRVRKARRNVRAYHHREQVELIVKNAYKEALATGRDLRVVLSGKLSEADRQLFSDCIEKRNEELVGNRADRKQTLDELADKYATWKSASSTSELHESGISFANAFNLFERLEDTKSMPRLAAELAKQYAAVQGTLQATMLQLFEELCDKAPLDRNAFVALLELLRDNKELAYRQRHIWPSSTLPRELTPIMPPANWRLLVGTHCDNPMLEDYLGDELEEPGRAILEAADAVNQKDWVNARWLLAHCKEPKWLQEIGPLLRSQLAFVSVSKATKVE